MSEKFLVRPKPFFDESFLGYISRLAEYNSYLTAYLVINHITKKMQKSRYAWRMILDNPYESASELADLTGNDVSDFLPKIQSVVNKNHYIFFNSSVWSYAINSYFPQYCPMCLKEKHYYRAIWDLIVYTACPIHKCLLINKCMQCGSNQKLFRNKTSECKCGFDFRDAEVTKIPENKIRIETHILKQLELAGINLDSQKNILLDNFSFPECVNALCFFTKRISVLKGYSKSIKRLSSDGLMHSLVNEALKIFDDFPLNYNIWLENTVKKVRHPSLTRTIKTLFYISHASPQKTLPARILPLIYTTFVNNVEPIFKKHSVANKPSIITDLIDENVLAEELNLETDMIKKLVKYKNIPLFQKIVVKTDDGIIFAGDSFLRAMDEVRKNMNSSKNVSVKSLMNLNKISKYLASKNLSFYKFISSVFKGRIKPCYEALDEDGLQRFLFSQKDVINFTQNKF